MRKMLLILLIVAVSGGVVSAQDDDSRAPIDALTWGADYFTYPEWDVSLVTTSDWISAYWTPVGGASAIVEYRQQFGLLLYTGYDIAKFVDEAYLDVLLQDYDSWEALDRCFSKAVFIVEIGTVFEGFSYNARYWFYSDEDVFVTVFAAFEPERADDLDAMAAHFFPENTSCEATL